MIGEPFTRSERISLALLLKDRDDRAYSAPVSEKPRPLDRLDIQDLRRARMGNRLITLEAEHVPG